ncbi:MAG TPA: 2-amino-4-hydroxy-6-hydroxymethyldihydropteridine diphosphokinase [Spirochaetales bacterium]|nr:2-amino-4-hydroxy-6-hydroxymethyldihydropteridine diphosphokinase [Spirochaetales bacterium]
MENVWLGLGSNLGDSIALIGEAFTLLQREITRMEISSLWRSRARYVEDQPDFVNAVVQGWTELEPQELLTCVHEIETALGRDRSKVVAKGPRTLDIDILLYGNRIIAEPNLVIPHPGMRERKFVLVPLLNLDSGVIDPVSSVSFLQYCSMLPAQGIYPIATADYDAAYP